ncbi:MAG TPA: NB-ARC domain-containing protein [Ktedonobacteraceae bacterium]|nr:NB-ARC domain-containing protein [Ktedonobacteraceae bacterium]
MSTNRPFSEQLRHERDLRGWSQDDLAGKMGCDPKTIGRWERGDSIPRSYHRQLLSQLFSKSVEELGLLQENSTPTTPGRPQGYAPTPLDHTPTIPQSSPLSIAPTALAQPTIIKEGHTGDYLSPASPREDWGEAPDIVYLYGREGEYNRLTRWIKDTHSRVVAILGMGGVGKTAVAAKIAMQTKQDFEYVFWRSLQNAPPPEIFLKQCISFVSHQQHADLPTEIDDQLSLLISALRDHRCLLVLDNFESVLQPEQSAGQFREGYAAYGRLLQRVGETRHTSCLLLTSREKPKEVALLEGKNVPVRSLNLSGLQLEAGQQMLQDKELIGTDAHWHALVERYSGNPLALRVVSESIQEIFGGHIDRFLQEEALAFGNINDVLDQQFQRLSAREREIIRWLAIEREPTSLDDLRADLVYPMSQGALLEALWSLRRRSLIEKRESAQFTLQPVILEYVTMRLIDQACQEFDVETPEVWIEFALCKAQAKDYVRDSQVRLLLAPIAGCLLARSGKEGIEKRARQWLADQRQAHPLQPGYLAGNMLNLLSYLHIDLRGMDFSRLVIQQAYLQGVMLPQVNFAYAHFIAPIFSNTFGNILSVACSPQADGHSSRATSHNLRAEGYNLRTGGRPQGYAPTAAGTSSGDILIYDALSGVLRLTCRGHTDGVWSLAFSPDGSLLASSSDDSDVRLWDSASGDCLRILEDHTNRVRSISFSPDGSTLASGSDDRTIRVWDTYSGDCLQTLIGHTDRVWSVAYSPDGKLLASGSTDQTVRLWDIQTGSCLATLQGHSGWVRSVAFDAEGSILASGSDDHTICLWDVSTHQHLHTLHGHSSRVWSVAFHPTKGILASGCEDQTVRVWDALSGRCIMLLQGHHAGVRSVTFTADGALLISGGDDQTIRVWDVSSSHCLRIMQGYTNRVLGIAFHLNSGLLASASEDASMRLWDVRAGRSLNVWQDDSHCVITIAFHPRGLTLASGGQDSTVRVWDATSERCLLTLRGHTNWVRAVAFSPDGNLLASGSEDGIIRLWNANSGACLSILPGHTSWVRSLAFSPNGSILASGGDDYMIRLWDVTTGSQLSILEAHTGRVRTIAFSPDGQLLASGSEDETIRFWDMDTRHCQDILQGHGSRIRSIAFNPDGGLLASGGDDADIHLWDVHTRRCLRELQGHTQRIRSVAFSPDGQTLSSSSDDGTIQCWDTQNYERLHTLIAERPYERMNITHVQGLTEAQKATLRVLGAIEES